MLKTRGLADFRAEYNIWRKDLAEELNLREGELERLEPVSYTHLRAHET